MLQKETNNINWEIFMNKNNNYNNNIFIESW